MSRAKVQIPDHLARNLRRSAETRTSDSQTIKRKLDEPVRSSSETKVQIRPRISARSLQEAQTILFPERSRPSQKKIKLSERWESRPMVHEAAPTPRLKQAQRKPPGLDVANTILTTAKTRYFLMCEQIYGIPVRRRIFYFAASIVGRYFNAQITPPSPQLISSPCGK